MNTLRYSLRRGLALTQQYPSATPSSRSTPILHRTVPTRLFSSTPAPCSHVGRAPLSVPPSVSIEVVPAAIDPTTTRRIREPPKNTLVVKGPLGELSMKIPHFVAISQDEATRKAAVNVADQTEKRQRAIWGTIRAYLSNYIFGVSEGHNTLLRLVGVGYRATIEQNATTVKPHFPGQKFVSLKVGYSHPIELGIPAGVTASTPQPTRILLEGIDKEVMNAFAAKIRRWRVPEPYKGKGIFVNDETIKLKNKKVK